MPLKLPFGLRSEDRKYVDVRAVDTGKKCGCICPVCEQPLVAKNRATNVRVAHFAHAADCIAAYETVIHETAKQIIRELGYVWLPKSIVAPVTKFNFSQHTLEKRYDRIVPDVTVWNNDKDKLAVEIRVTHPVDEAKLATLKRMRLSCVEFDLSELPREVTYDDLRRSFEENRVPSAWVFNRRARKEEIRRNEESRRRAAEIADHNRKVFALARKEAVRRQVHSRRNRYGYPIYHVDPCPRDMRAGGLANVNLDCRQCDFCFRIRLQNRVPIEVICGGHKAMDILPRKGLGALEAHGNPELDLIANRKGFPFPTT